MKLLPLGCAHCLTEHMHGVPCKPCMVVEVELCTTWLCGTTCAGCRVHLRLELSRRAYKVGYTGTGYRAALRAPRRREGVE